MGIEGNLWVCNVQSQTGKSEKAKEPAYQGEDLVDIKISRGEAITVV